MYKNIILPASILAGTIIGAGMFSLPFVFKEAGLLSGLFYLALFGVTFIFVYLLYADLILRTPGEHRFVGYAKLYLGNSGFWAALLIGLAQLFFVLTIYLILAPSFSKLLIAGNNFYHFLFFWILGSSVILFDIKRIAWLEFLIVAGMAAIIALISLFGLKDFILSPIGWGNPDFSKFLSAGPILFALSGSLIVPEVVSYFRASAIPISFLKKSLMLGGILPVLAYLAFVFGILGLSGSVSEDAVSGLVGRAPAWILVLAGILGFLSLISSYIAIGLNARKILQYDLFIFGWLSKLLVIIIPPILYFLGLQNFIKAVSFTGSIFMPLESIFIIFMWLKADRKSEIPPIVAGQFTRTIIPVLLLIFFMALIYVIIK